MIEKSEIEKIEELREELIRQVQEDLKNLSFFAKQRNATFIPEVQEDPETQLGDFIEDIVHS